MIQLELERWVVLAAWDAFLATILSAVWRVLMITGLIPGASRCRTGLRPATGGHGHLLRADSVVGPVRVGGHRRLLATPSWGLIRCRMTIVWWGHRVRS